MDLMIDSISKVIESEELLEVGRKAIEDVLIDFRDSRISHPNRGNGLVCCEKDGEPSSVIRLGPESGLKIALKAIVEHLKEKKKVLNNV